MCQLGRFVEIVEIEEKDALIGYRSWRKVRGKLKPIFQNIRLTEWEVGKAIQSDRPPKRRNTNGLWCWNEENKNNPMYKQYTKGKIKIWGTVIAYKMGYRAQFAQIVKIFPKVAAKKAVVKKRAKV